MKGHRLVITFVAVALVAALIGAGAAATRGTPDWLDALNARSAALNERYGLGDDAARRTLEVPGLGHHGLTAAAIPTLVSRAREASSMRGNLLALTDGELTEIAERAL